MLTKEDFYKESGKPKEQLPVSENKQGISNYAQSVLVGLVITSYFLMGMMYKEISVLKSQGSIAGTQAKSADFVPTNNAITPPPVAQQISVDKVTSGDHLLGNLNSRLQLIVYSDFECPFSKRFQTTTLKQVLDQYKDKVAIIYRHFPLDQIHSQARKEAQATECAAKLAGNDGFWKLTDKIYEITPSNNGLDLTQLPSLAVQVGINKTAFQTCLDSGQMATIVEAQYQSGVRAGVNGTPGSFLVDSKTGSVQSISGAVPFEQMKQSIDKILSN